MKKTFISKGIFTCLAAILSAAASFAQSITTGTISPVTYCAGSSVSVEFTTTGTFTTGNVFTAQLSDASGSFTTPLATSTGTSPISVTIPVSATTGAGYKVRVVASLPVTTGTESAAFTVNAKPAAPTVVSPVPYTVGDMPAVLTASGVSDATFTWYDASTSGNLLSPAPTPTTTAAGTQKYYVSQTVSGCESTRAEIVVTVTCTPPADPVVVNKTYTVGDTPVSLALSVTGTGLKWYTGSTGGSGSGTPPAISTASAGTTSHWVTQTVGGCESGRVKIDVIVNACTPPAAPTVSPVSYTVGATAVALTASGTDLKWYEVVSGGSPLGSAPTPLTTTVGAKSYWVTQTVGGCESARAEIVVTINACTPPALPTVSPVSYTVGATAVALTATGVTGSTLKWYDVASGGSPLGSAPTPVTTTVGTKSYYVTQTVGGCESSRAEIVVTINACTPPALPTVSPVSYTVGATASVLTATGVTGSTLKWYDAASGGSPLGSAPIPVTTTVGTKSYYVTQTVGGCESARAEIVVTINACTPPALPTVSPVSYTVGATAVALTATGVTGSTLKWYDVASGGSPLGSAPTPVTTTVGTKSYYVTQTVGGCESARAEIVVTINACTPPAAPTVSPVSYTVGATAVALTATGVTGSTLKWYDVSSGGSPLGSAPTPVTTTVGTKSYWVAQTVSNCESARAEIVVTISACVISAAPTVTSPTDYCASATPVSALVATGTAIKWYNSSSVLLGSAPVPVVNVSSTTSTTYYVTQTESGKCESAKKEVVVNVYKTPAPGVGTAVVEFCLNGPSTALTATGTALKWYASTTGSTEVPSTPNTGTAGNQIFYVSQTLNGCESERARIDVKIKSLPAAPTATVIAPVCENTSVASSVLLNAVTPKTNLLWYAATSGGSGSSTVPAVVTTSGGVKNFYVTQTVDGCESATRGVVSIDVKALPAAPTVTPVEYCKDATASPLTATGTGLKWYNAAGTLLSAAPTPLTAASSFYSVSQTTTPAPSLTCEGPKARLDVTINALPATLKIDPEEYCKEKDSKPYTFTVTPDNGNTIAWYKTLEGGTAEASVPTINLNTAATTIYYAAQVSSKSCQSAARTEKKVRVKPLPAQPTVTALVEYCQFVAATPLTATPATNLSWFTSETSSTPLGAAPTPSTAAGGTTAYFVAQTVEACTSDRAKIEVKINTTVKPVTTTALAYCQGEVAPVLAATGTVLKWYRTADATESQGVPFTPFTEKVQDYSFFVTQTGTNGCESPKEEIKIHIKALPSATISGTTTIDLGQVANLKIDFTSDGPWTYVLSSGKTATSTTATTVIPVTPSVTTTYIVTEVSNACGKGFPIGKAEVTVKIPTITTGNPSAAEACAGKTFSLLFAQSGEFPKDNKFVAQISTTNEDGKFYSIPSVVNGSTITATFPDTTKGGTYLVRVVSEGTNPAFTVKGSVSQIGIKANPIPTAVITGSKTILIGESADLNVEIFGEAPWTFTLNNGVSDSLISISTSPYSFKIKPSKTTIYTITSVTNTCGTGKGSGSARIQVDPILGVEPAVTDWMKVYPTMVDEKCMVEITEPVSAKGAKLEVIDLNGRVLQHKLTRDKISDMDFRTYPSGVYLIRVQNGELSGVQRVIKP